jgi:hypothetical protein
MKRAFFPAARGLVCTGIALALSFGSSLACAQPFSMRIGNNNASVPTSHDVPAKNRSGGWGRVIYFVETPSTVEQRAATMRRHRAEIAEAGTPAPELIGYPIPPGFTYDKSHTLNNVTHYGHQLQGKTFYFSGCADRWLQRSYAKGFLQSLIQTRRAVDVSEFAHASCQAGQFRVLIGVYVSDDSPRGVLLPTDFNGLDFLELYKRAKASPPTVEQLGIAILPGSHLLPVATAEMAAERGVTNTSSTGYAAVYFKCHIAENESDDFYEKAFAQFGAGRVNTWETSDDNGLCERTSGRPAWMSFAILASPTAAAK